MSSAQHLAMGAWAVVRLVDGSLERGILYARDPESGHVLLLRPDEQPGADRRAVRPRLIFSASISEVIQEPPEATPEQMQFREALLTRVVEGHEQRAGGEVEPSTQAARQAAVRDLLLAHRLPFEERERGVFVVLGCLEVGPPYTAHSCRCENEIVLDRFLQMLEMIPDSLPELGPTAG